MADAAVSAQTSLDLRKEKSNGRVKPRIKPTRQAKKGDLVEVKALVSHIMETANARTAPGL